MNNYVCKIASLEELERKWQYEIDNATDDKSNWIKWQKQMIDRYNSGKIIPYYGILNGKIICECTAAIDASVIQNSENLIDDKTAYLFAFRTIKEYENQGFFSKLFKFMLADLKTKGYKRVTLGVEPEEKRNKAIYAKYGFTKHIKDAQETYPDGTIIDVEYYGKFI